MPSCNNNNNNRNRAGSAEDSWHVQSREAVPLSSLLLASPRRDPSPSPLGLIPSYLSPMNEPRPVADIVASALQVAHGEYDFALEDRRRRGGTRTGSPKTTASS